MALFSQSRLLQTWCNWINFVFLGSLCVKFRKAVPLLVSLPSGVLLFLKLSLGRAWDLALCPRAFLPSTPGSFPPAPQDLPAVTYLVFLSANYSLLGFPAPPHLDTTLVPLLRAHLLSSVCPLLVLSLHPTAFPPSLCYSCPLLSTPCRVSVQVSVSLL